MFATEPSHIASNGPLRPEEIKKRVESVPKLPSLQSIGRVLTDLVNSEQSYNSHIAEIIRRDPSLTARLLRMVNSVYFGLAAKVNNIEEAVFYLGLRQIRELSMATPVIDEIDKQMSQDNPALPWKQLWKHSIGCAIMTREILTTTNLLIDDDTDYIIGLLHNIGKVVMAYAFPQELRRMIDTPCADTIEACKLERELIGWDHAQIGGYFLQRHQLAPEITDAVLYHNEPEKAPRHAFFAAAVQIADVLVRSAGIGCGFEQVNPVLESSVTELSGWKILYGSGEKEMRIASAALFNSLNRLPTLLQGLV